MAYDVTKPPKKYESIWDENLAAGRALAEESIQAGRALFEENIKAGQDLVAEHERLSRELEEEHRRLSAEMAAERDHVDLAERNVDSFGEPIDDPEPPDPVIIDDEEVVNEQKPQGDGTLHIYRQDAQDLIPDSPDDQGGTGTGTGGGASTDNGEPPDLAVDTEVPPESPSEKFLRMLYTKYGKKKVGNHHCETPILDERGKEMGEVEHGLIDERGGQYDDKVLDEILNQLLGIEDNTDSMFYSEPEPEPPPPPPVLSAQELFEMVRYKPRKCEDKPENIEVNVCCGSSTPAPAPEPEEPKPLRPKISDIVFVIDTTGSMTTYLAAVKANISAYVDRLKSKGIDLRLGLIAYGDVNIGEKIVKNDFTTDVETFKGYLSSITRYAGGDIAESTLDAINDPSSGAKSFTFREDATREYVVITDAITHTTDDKLSKYSLDGTLTALKSDHVITSVISKLGGQEETQYKPIVDGTNGKLLDITGNFGDQLLVLADNTDDSFYKPLPS